MNVGFNVIINYLNRNHNVFDKHVASRRDGQDFFTHPSGAESRTTIQGSNPECSVWPE